MRKLIIIILPILALAVSVQTAHAQQTWKIWYEDSLNKTPSVGTFRQILASGGLFYVRADSDVIKNGPELGYWKNRLGGFHSTGMALDGSSSISSAIISNGTGTLAFGDGSSNSGGDHSFYLLGYSPDDELMYTNGRPGQVYSQVLWRSPWGLCDHGDSLPINAFSCGQDTSIWIASDSGISRNRIGGSVYFRTGLPNAPADLITILPTGPVIASFSGHGLYRTRDNGKTWSRLKPPTDNVLCLTAYANFLFAGGRHWGIWVSTDEGTTWSDDNTGLPSTEDITVTSIAVDTTYFTQNFEDWMYLTTPDKVYSSSVIYTHASAPRVTPGNVLGLNNSPNPFSTRTQIGYHLPESTSTLISLYSLLGQKVWEQPSRVEQAGEHTVEIDLSGQPAGVYCMRLQAGGERVTRMIVKE
jgi:hypothetical protein